MERHCVVDLHDSDDWRPRERLGSGPSDVWAVGAGILHWDGSAWTAATIVTMIYLLGVWGSGPSR